jgi:hypothetical protein
VGDKTLNPWEIITTELPKWWREERARGDATGEITLPDVADLFIPETPADAALMVATGPVGRAVRLGAAGLGGMLAADDAQAAGSGSVRAAGKIANKVRAAILRNRQRVAFPGIYDNPRVIAEDAAKRVAPENPLMKQLFGVTREDLAEIASKPAAETMKLPGAPAKPTGSAAAEAIQTPSNRQRLVDVLAEVKQRAPELEVGMRGWYPLDPLWRKFVQELGEEEGTKAFMRFNSFAGLESPNLPVTVELQRASAAERAFRTGEWDKWKKFGGLPPEAKIREGAPDWMVGVPGRVGHGLRVQGQEAVIAGDRYGGAMSPKVPAYIDASLPEGLGRQIDQFVGDAHWARAVGLPDVRTAKGFAESVTMPEAVALKPWWAGIAKDVGMNPVQAQAVTWGAFAPRTGVDTVIGPPKLELLTNLLEKTAAREGISPQEALHRFIVNAEWLGEPTAQSVRARAAALRAK